MTPIPDILIGLAANLAYDLIRAGAARLKALALGEPAQIALHKCYEAGFQAMLEAIAPDLEPDELGLMEDIFRDFVATPAVVDALLDVALAGAALPDLPALAEQFAAQFDLATTPVDFNQPVLAFHRGLTGALVAEASQQNSPLFNQVNLGRVIALQTLLQGQARSLEEIGRRLAQLEAQGGPTVYNIVIAQATGVAIGDGATVQGVLPPDVLQMLADMLALVRDLHTARRPPTFSDEDVRIYLRTVVEQCQTLDLRGTGGPVHSLPLERVYVALRADASNAAERRANYAQFVADLEEALAARGDLDERQQLQVWRQVMAGRDPLGLTLALRDRGASDDATYLARQAKRINLGELAARERWVVLLGDPGSGKTTLLRWLALQFARAGLDEQARVVVAAEQVRAEDHEKRPDKQGTVDLGPTRLPVPLRLADYEAARWAQGRDSGLELFDYVGQQPWLGAALHPDRTIAAALVQDAIRRGQALILLDGLDEITDRHRRGQVVDAIVRFLGTWVRDPASGLCAAEEGYAPWQIAEEANPQRLGGNQVLVTSRPIGYNMAPLPGALPHYTVEEMSEAAVGRFCQAWTAAVHAASGQGHPETDAEGLRQAVLDPDRPGTREIAANPLLLTILAGLWYTLQGRLPQRRIELYDQAVRAFLRQRPEGWKATGLRDKAFRYAMGAAAVRLHASVTHPSGLVEEEELQEWLEEALVAYEGRYYPKLSEQANLLLESAQAVSGFLLERGDGVYGFIHRTFQEYFAAVYLAWDRQKVVEEVVARLDEPAWQVVLVLAVAETGLRKRAALPRLLKAILAAPEPAEGLIPRNALLVAACAPELTVQAPDAALAAAARRLIAAYADRDWPPGEDTQAPAPLRQAIGAAVRGMRAQPGALAAVAEALNSEDPAQRLAAAELILATEWTTADLVAPLIRAARAQVEPAATIREALVLQHHGHSAAFTDELLPMRHLLKDGALLTSLDQHPDRRAILEALYVVPDALTQHTGWSAEHVIFDSELTHLLEQAWCLNWDETTLAARLERLAVKQGTAIGRDAAWALAVIDDARRAAVECPRPRPRPRPSPQLLPRPRPPPRRRPRHRPRP